MFSIEQYSTGRLRVAKMFLLNRRCPQCLDIPIEPVAVVLRCWGLSAEVCPIPASLCAPTSIKCPCGTREK